MLKIRGKRMRYFVVLIAALIVAGCRPATPKTDDPPPTESVAGFLLASSANDFHTHRPPDPVRFRNVRLGHLTTAAGEPQYVLCGEFLPAEARGEDGWTAFATIKTDPYEQWLGNQAAGVCGGSTIAWDGEEDLSSALQSRLDALR